MAKRNKKPSKVTPAKLTAAQRRRLFPDAPKKRTRADWQQIARDVSRFGYATKADTTARQTPAWKRKISRARHLAATYSEKNRFIFRRQSAKQRESLAPFVSARQVAPNGVFLQIPKGMKPGKVKFSATKSVLNVRYGKRVERIVKLDTKALVLNPAGAARKAVAAGRVKGKRIRAVQIMVNGFQGRATIELSQFFYYMANTLLPELTNPKRRKGKLSAEQISDMFHVKIIYQNRRK